MARGPTQSKITKHPWRGGPTQSKITKHPWRRRLTQSKITKHPWRGGPTQSKINYTHPWPRRANTKRDNQPVLVSILAFFFFCKKIPAASRNTTDFGLIRNKNLTQFSEYATVSVRRKVMLRRRLGSRS